MFYVLVSRQRDGNAAHTHRAEGTDSTDSPEHDYKFRRVSGSVHRPHCRRVLLSLWIILLAAAAFIIVHNLHVLRISKIYDQHRHKTESESAQVGCPVLSAGVGPGPGFGFQGWCCLSSTSCTLFCFQALK